MITLSTLKNVHPRKMTRRKGRGPSSGRGKTSCRGHKGQKSRSGARVRDHYEGGQMRLYMKLPKRGFTRGRFEKPYSIINLDDIEKIYQDGETVNMQTLHEKGFLPNKLPSGIKVLSKGDITKKVVIEANKFSKETVKKLEEKKISYKILG